ncbi:MAG: hypothetical protein ABIR37_04370 [Candidatus Saccharimonadales bacterium]
MDHLWFLNLNWPVGWFVSLMIIAIIVLVLTHGRHETNYRRSVNWYVPNVWGLLFFTAVLYLGVHWEPWWWVRILILIGWWGGLLFAVVSLRGSFGPLASWLAHLAFNLVLLMLVISFIGWLLHGNLHLNWWWLFWLLVVVALVALVFGLVRHFAAVAILALVALLVLALAGSSLFLFGGNRDNQVAGPTPTVTTTVSPTATPAPTITVTATAPPVDAQKLLDQLFGPKGLAPGMQKQVAIGDKNIDWKNRTEARGTAAFSRKTLKTQQDVANFLNGSSDESKAAKARVVKALKPYGQAEVNRALNGSGYFPLQVKEAAQILGTTYFKNGKVFEMGSWRTVKSNDVFWIFMTQKGVIVKDAAVRADCGNVHLTQIRPITPSTPLAPSVECAVNCKVVSPPHGCVPSQMPHRPGSIVLGNCTYKKVDQSDSCMLYGTGCQVPNVFVQKPQSKPVGTTTGAPATPTSSQSSSTAPGGSSGTSTGTATGTPSCSTETGCGGDHSAPSPTTVIP